MREAGTRSASAAATTPRARSPATIWPSHFKNEKIAILNDNSAYGKGLADETMKSLHAAGGKEVLATAYTPGEKDYSSLVSRLKQAGVTVIYVGGYHTEAGLIIRQAKEQGMKATLVGGDALVTNEFWQIAGEAGAGTMMTFPPDPRLMKTAADVVKEFKAKKVDPEGYVLYTYAAIQVWADAVKKVGSTDPKKVAAALKATGTGRRCWGRSALTRRATRPAAAMCSTSGRMVPTPRCSEPSGMARRC